MELNKYIEHTNLSTMAREEDIKRLCEEAKAYHFESICVHPFYVAYAKQMLQKSNVGITTVVGFPLGMNTTEVKEYEAIDAINKGADEIDMVINMGCVKNKDYAFIKKEIETVRDSIDGHPLKIIVEACNLEEDEVIKLTEICNETFVNFIKTSTGFGESGTTIETIKLINQHKSEVLEIKASGEIQTEEQAIRMIEAGATRIETSHGVEMVTEKKCCREKVDCNHCTCNEENIHECL